MDIYSIVFDKLVLKRYLNTPIVSFWQFKLHNLIYFLFVHCIVHLVKYHFLVAFWFDSKVLIIRVLLINAVFWFKVIFLRNIVFPLILFNEKEKAIFIYKNVSLSL